MRAPKLTIPLAFLTDARLGFNEVIKWAQKLDFGATYRPVRFVAVDLTLDDAVNQGLVRVDASMGARTIALPPSPQTGFWFTLKKVDASANGVTLTGVGTLATQGDRVTVLFNGTSWEEV